MPKAERVFIVEVTQANGLKTHYVNQPSFVLGRGPSSALKFEDTNISREHVKIFFDEGIKIQDLKSSNGTFVNNKRLEAMAEYMLHDNDVVRLGHSSISLKIKTFSSHEGTNLSNDRISPKEASDKTEIVRFYDHPPELPLRGPDLDARPPAVQAQPSAAQPPAAQPPAAQPAAGPAVKVNISGFPSTEDEMKVDFKNVQVDVKNYRDPGEHAREIITEANYVKHTIIKGAIVQKQKILNEANVQSKIIADKAYQDYRDRLQVLISETKMQMQHLKTETESHLDDKKMLALKEIEQLWHEHQDHVEVEKKNIAQKLMDQNENELEIERERLANEMFIEKNKILTEAESTVMAQTVAYRAQFENEKTEHNEKINLFARQISELKSEEESLAHKIDSIKNEINVRQMDLDKSISNLKIENDKLEVLQKRNKDLEVDNVKIKDALEGFQKNRDALVEAGLEAQSTLTDLTTKVNFLSEKKVELTQLVADLEKTRLEAKLKAKFEVDREYQDLRKIEADRFEEFKVKELKELQKIRIDHTNSFKKFSLELSQEIAVKLEMQAKKAGLEFVFDKNLEIINSVIHVKSSEITGVQSNHQNQMDSWKQKQKSEKTFVFISGAVASVLIYISGNFLYGKFSTDSQKLEIARASELRRQKEIDNIFVPEKGQKYFDTYVDATIYTENFTETYLDDEYQNEWIKKVTMYFLQTWKIDEQQTIRVLANAKSLVQNIDEASKKLTKSRLKNDIEKLRKLEQQNVDAQIAILGTNVKYEAFKKLEKQFFLDKMKKRSPANRR